MDAPTEVTRWNGGNYRDISLAMARARTTEHLNMLFFGKNIRLEVCFPVLFALSSLLLLLIMTQTPHFHALSHENR